MAKTTSRRSTSGKKISNRKSSAKKPVARKAVAKETTRKTVTTARGTPRVVSADGHKVPQPTQTRPPPQPRLNVADRTKAFMAESEQIDHIDTSYVIVDYTKLRLAAIRAMGGDIENTSPDELVQVEGVDVVDGSFATQAVGTQLSIKLRQQRKGPGTVIPVHPLDFHVLEGADRINPRDFTTPEMIQRVAEMTIDVANNGIRDPAKAFVRDDFLFGLGGETRHRASLHAWILTAKGVIPSAPDTMPVILTRRGTNDADTQLDVLKDNDVKNLQPMEIARAVRNAFRMGKDEAGIAKHLNKPVFWVRGMLNLVEMPEKVQTMIIRGEIKPHLAAKVWEAEKQNPTRTVSVLEEARRIQQSSGAKRILPRHVQETKSTSEPKETTRQTRTTTGPTTPPTSPPTRSGSDIVNKLVQTVDEVGAVLRDAKLISMGENVWHIVVTSQQIVDVLGPRLGMTIPEVLLNPEEGEKTQSSAPEEGEEIQSSAPEEGEETEGEETEGQTVSEGAEAEEGSDKALEGFEQDPEGEPDEPAAAAAA